MLEEKKLRWVTNGGLAPMEQLLSVQVLWDTFHRRMYTIGQKKTKAQLIAVLRYVLLKRMTIRKNLQLLRIVIKMK